MRTLIVAGTSMSAFIGFGETDELSNEIVTIWEAAEIANVTIMTPQGPNMMSIVRPIHFAHFEPVSEIRVRPNYTYVVDRLHPLNKEALKNAYTSFLQKMQEDSVRKRAGDAGILLANGQNLRAVDKAAEESGVGKAEFSHRLKGGK